MSAPTLSVLMPSYNHARHLGQALAAVLRQSERPIEVLVVDDASTDGSAALVEQFARLDGRVRLLRNDRNRGAVFSLNRALAEARGDYVYGAAADDLVLPGFFRKALRLAALHTHAGIVCGQWLKVDFAGRELELHTAAGREVHGVGQVQAAQLGERQLGLAAQRDQYEAGSHQLEYVEIFHHPQVERGENQSQRGQPSVAIRFLDGAQHQPLRDQKEKQDDEEMTV